MKKKIVRDAANGRGKAFRMAAYLLAVVLVYSCVSVLCSAGTVTIYPAADGVADLRSVNFDKFVAVVSTDTAVIYEGAFYSPEAFSAGQVTQEGTYVVGKTPRLGNFGTIRFVLRLPPGKIYTIASLSAAYAQRLFINGEELMPVGVTGDSADEVIPRVARYTEVFQPQTDVTEIILHYSNLVHPDAGYLYAPQIGYADAVTRVEQLRTFQVAIVTGTLLTATLFFFGLYLFSPENRYLLWFSLVCASIALRGLLVGDVLLKLLLPNLSWYADIRIKYLGGFGLVLFSALCLNALFSGAANKWVVRGFVVFCLGNAVFFLFTPPMVFAGFIWQTLAVCVVYFLYALVSIFRSVFQKRAAGVTSLFEWMLLPGACLYLLLFALEIYAHENALYLWGLDFAQVGMLIFLFLNILALLLQFLRTRQELSHALQREREMSQANRMLESLVRAKTDFLDSLSHEMKTPLAVMSNCAGLTLHQLRRNQTNNETEENLDMIQRESVRLGRLVEQLMKVSLEKERQFTLTDTDAGVLLRRAADFCALLCRENGNRIIIKTGQEPIPVRVNADSLFQVLINLITNANRHTRSGEIVLCAAETPADVLFEVSDNGEGIPPELLRHVFERGVSGSGRSGLGLPICKEILDEHGGSLSVESGSTGTRVSFTLPRVKEEEPV